MDHPKKCPLWDEEETIQHLLSTCVFSRQVWLAILSPLQVGGATLHSNKCSFANPPIRKVKESRKRANSLIIFTSWLIWRHRDACVFDGILPSVDEVLKQIRDEYQIWGLALEPRIS
jgi:hypothetical protein